ncbi:MAG: hypothetical protein P8103_16360 [Candidatus Thiodiazotropha sp.]|jgi:hypothetical protein
MTDHPGLVPTDQPTRLEIADGGRILCFSYAQALDFHRGNSYWGCALAFRMLQRAAPLLSRQRLWDRNRLQVVSGHPGPGVRDTLELVTGCVSDGRFSLEGGPREARCVGDMAYRWHLSDDTTELSLQLADGIVPPQFLQLLDKIDKTPATEADKAQLEAYKQSMTRTLWGMPLEAAFPDSGLILTPL